MEIEESWNCTGDGWSYRNDKDNSYFVLKNHSGEYHSKRATSGGSQWFGEDSEEPLERGCENEISQFGS